MFPISKNGHTFTFAEDGLQYRSPEQREIHLPFTGRIRVGHSPWSGSLSLKGSGGRIPLHPLDSGERLELMRELFRRWSAVHPEAAKKAAFDYIDGQKGFVPVAFVACLLFSLPMAVGLLADSRLQFACTKVLRENSVLGTMDVVKFKKKRKGHYILDLEFTAPDGMKILGNDQLITLDETKIPKQVPVVYSPEHPECWSLTPNLEGTEVNWAKRRYFGFFTGLFGLFFLSVSLLGIGWAIGKWTHPRPYREELKSLFHLNA